MNKAERKQLALDFLEKLRDGADNSCGNKYTLRFANSTNHFFEKRLIFRSTIKEKITNFTLENYHYGPTKDKDDYPGDVWEFGFNFRNQEIYIKFRIHKNYIKCFKLHRSKKKNIRYPFK